MRIRLRLFASYAEAFGRGEIILDLPTGASAGDALAAIRERPGAEKLPPRPMIAVNQRYAKEEAPLADGDEVALIPPVAGG
ncbi:MAG TPA: MoaD/ThiS family protein [Gemmatimonadales bacterium]